MNLIELSVKRPIATGVIFSFICAGGALLWNRLPQEVMPELNFPQLTIVTGYAQAAPQEIENLITKPIEEAVGTVKNVKRVHSISKEGTSIVTVEFSWGTNMDFASLNTREKLDLIKSRLPQDAREPTVIKYNPFYMPVLILSLNAEEAVEPEFLSHVAQMTVANKLQKVEGVAAVQLSGVSEKEIHVDLDQTRLAANNVTLLQFNHELSQANYKGAAGTAKEGSYDYAVRVVSPFDSVEDIRSAVISVDNPRQPTAAQRNSKSNSYDRQHQRAISGDERLISVSHVGDVSEGLKERSSYSRYDGKENITIMIQKQASASTLNTVAHLKEALTDLKPLLPSDISLSIVYDQAHDIKKGINDVLRSAVEGGVLAFFILYLFLKSWRDASIVSVVIPASCLITIIIMYGIGMSLNMISMGGIALGIGHLVDASICVTENIHRRHHDLKEPLETAVILGTQEVAGAVTSSILTSIAVFLPLLFVAGLLGQLFRDLSLTVTISQLVSLLVSVTLVPMLAYVVGKGGEFKSRHPREGGDPFLKPYFKKWFKDWMPAFAGMTKFLSFDRFKDWYIEHLRWSFGNARKVWGTVLFLFIGSIFVLGIIPHEFLPHTDADQLTCRLTLANGTNLERTNEIAKVLEAAIMQMKDVEHTTVTVGSSSDSPLVLFGKNEAQILIDLKRKRSRRGAEILEDIRRKIAELPLKGGHVEMAEGGGSLSFVQGQNAPLMVYLKGYDLLKLKKASERLIDNLSHVRGLAQLRDSLALPAPEIRLNIDKERAAHMGLNVSDIGRTAMAAYHGQEVTQIYREGQEIPILVRLKAEDRKNTSTLRTLLLPNPNGGTIPLQDLASLEIGEGPSQIERIDQERCVLIRGDHTREFKGSSNKEVQKIIDGFSMPDITLEEAGEKKAERESFLSLCITLFISVLLVFMVMAVQFESLTQPFLILFTIPMSVIGMAGGLFIMGKTVNAVSGMGLLLLAGIVVNNGIVLIDFVNSERTRQANLKEALIHGCQTRLRPIILTALTTIVGLIPLAFGIGEGAELQSPMAITVIFGLAVSTVLTLIALPTLFWFVENIPPLPYKGGARGGH